MTHSDPTLSLRRLQELSRDGHATSASELLPLVYEDLRSMAQVQLRNRPGTLQATSLVHEAWIRVVGEEDPGWECRSHFFGAVARAMRHILVEQARRKGSLRHGGAWGRAALSDQFPELSCGLSTMELLALNEALEELEERSSRQAKIVMLRFFAGLKMSDIADVLGVNLKRVEREWTFARAWLELRMSDGPGEGDL